MGKRKQPIGKHHRLPRSHGGRSNAENISLVPVHQHRAYHTLFGNSTPEQIAGILTATWIDPSYIMIAIPKDKGLSLKQLVELLKQ